MRKHLPARGDGALGQMPGAAMASGEEPPHTCHCGFQPQNILYNQNMPCVALGVDINDVI